MRQLECIVKDCCTYHDSGGNNSGKNELEEAAHFVDEGPVSTLLPLAFPTSFAKNKKNHYIMIISQLCIFAHLQITRFLRKENKLFGIIP